MMSSKCLACSLCACGTENCVGVSLVFICGFMAKRDMKHEMQPVAGLTCLSYLLSMVLVWFLLCASDTVVTVR